MTSRKLRFAWALGILLPAPSYCGSKPPVVGLGAVRREAYSSEGDPAGALKDEKELKVRPLVVDGKVKEWTTGDAHDVTERSFAVRRAVRLNDSLPTDHVARWVWPRGRWTL